MGRNFSIRSLLILALPLLIHSFTPQIPTFGSRDILSLRSTENDVEVPPAKPVERGVSMDQDGKSNVWAIEPKMEVSAKSSEENTQSALIAAGGAAAFIGIAAVTLLNLPDPNQF